ncbi:cytochrome c biogenesis CcdA family protein [Aquipuribacter nitratireducens]|uniref:Cytochrome c biogenesis CcdA family protein n=1 Tax=Aquipuribacter nitratireducens TaxID=650104 RepID=A0ABW0GRA8_9MICO
MTGAAETVLDGSLLLALPLALLAGLVSFASPCVLPLVPGYLAYVSAMGEQRPQPAATGGGGTAVATRLADPATAPTRRLVAGASLFVLGFAVVFVALGSLAGVAGALLPRARLVDVVAGVLAVGLGLVFAGVVPLGRTERRLHVRPAVGLAGAPLLGAAFGVGWVPCVGPTLGAVLLLAGTEGGAGRGALLAFVYCLGLGVPFVLVAAAYARGLVRLEPLRRHRRLLTGIGGAMLVVVGLLLVTGAWDWLVGWLQGPISRFGVLL